MSLFGGQSKAEIEDVETMQQDEMQDMNKKSEVTVISDGIKLVGDISGNGQVLIEGTLDGSIDITGEVKIIQGGIVNGPVIADALIVSGQICGDIITYDRLVISTSGDVTGTVRTKSLIIDDGGKLNGKSIMSEELDRSKPIILNKETKDKAEAEDKGEDEVQGETEDEAKAEGEDKTKGEAEDKTKGENQGEAEGKTEGTAEKKANISKDGQTEQSQSGRSSPGTKDKIKKQI